jgi:class 3 adenylate cyclase
VTDTGGPIDFVYMIGQGSAFDVWWGHPNYAKVFERWASFGRLILFDRRGCGSSDRPPAERIASSEQFAEDLEAVLDAAESERAAIFAAFDGGPIALTYAATHPERVRALMLWNTYARNVTTEGYPIGQSLEATEEMMRWMAPLWGTEEMAKMLSPDEADDAEFMRFLATCLRASETPQSWLADAIRGTASDARAALPLIVAPTLVMRRRQMAWAHAETSQYLVDNIAGARLMEFDGSGIGVWGVQSDEILDAIEEFVTGTRRRVRTDRVLATVVFTDIVGSTARASELGDARWKQLLATHDGTARRVIEEWRGELVKTTGDGVVARFDGPGRAVNCTQEFMGELRRHGIDIRAGVHVGEIELRDDGDVGGIAVHIAARVQAKATAGELLCSRTVKDLTAGSGLMFEDRGTHELKGVADKWELFAVS